jgi:hypothetical protein
MQTIGEELGVAGQAVHKRLNAARWKEVAKAIEYLESRHPGLSGGARNAAADLPARPRA